MSEGFNVNEPVEIDVQDVKEQRIVIPAAKDVKFRIKKAELRMRRVKSEKEGGTGEDNPPVTKSIALELSLVDGVGEGKFKNKSMFQDVCYWADPAIKMSDWYKNKQHLVPLRFLLSALGIPLKGSIGDELIGQLQGREVLGTISLKKMQAFDPSTGKYVDTDDFKNEVGKFKAVI